MLQSKAGYIDARPHIRQLDEIFLQRTAGPYIRVIFDPRGRSDTFLFVRFAPKATFTNQDVIRRFVLIAT